MAAARMDGPEAAQTESPGGGSIGTAPGALAPNRIRFESWGLWGLGALGAGAFLWNPFWILGMIRGWGLGAVGAGGCRGWGL